MKITHLAVLFCLAFPPLHAQSPTNPPAKTIIEVFTNKYCPNCPPTEKKLSKIAEQNQNLIVIFNHVDYWDTPERKDPFSLPEATERQYDYSNTVGPRPGQVFTPMPLINGQFVVNPPLFLNWSNTLKKAQNAPQLAQIEAKQAKSGESLTLKIPATLAKKDNEIWLLTLKPATTITPTAYHLTALQQYEIKGETTTISANLAPKSKPFLVLIQQKGPGPLLGQSLIE